jgi:phosphoadenosine phosphosulfate reductase
MAQMNAPILTREKIIAASVSQDLESLVSRYEGLQGADLLAQMINTEFKDRIAVVSSFGAESVVLLHMVAEIDPTTPIIFLNTGKLFGETLRYRDRLQERLGLTDVRAIGPHPDDTKRVDPGGDLWQRDHDACCDFRKVLPLARALRGFDAQITGRKRFQTEGRSGLSPIEIDPARGDGFFKINPLSTWTLTELTRYIEEQRLPKHPLVKDGYLSLGCMACTDRVKPGGDYREGRWAGSDKDECGIHQNVDGDGI